MAEHTPGPWDTGGDEHNICSDRDGRRVIVAMVSHDITGDTLSGPSGCEEEHRECHANARLIAAVPELLETLELCRSNIKTLNAVREMEGVVQWDAWLEVVEQTIAKAKGESRE
mgnify:CR=1 FL=1